MPRKRARTDSWVSRTVSHEAQDVPSIDHDGLDTNSIAENELPVRSRKLPEASRAGGRIPRENILSGSTAHLASMPPQRARRDMQIPDELNLDDEAVLTLQRAPHHPPVNTKTLSELDLICIMANANLRVDVNYDHDLHFMPVRGKKGDQKRRDAQKYWTALSYELQIYNFAARQPASLQQSRLKVFWQRLPLMFEDLKDLLLTLIPETESKSIHETLDIPLLMQQVEKGVLDIAKLARWLAELLKNHCAPMRDIWADDMVRRVEDGLARQDTTCIVAGLEKLFSILEAMKLDVANHQIRTFRLFLIEDTIKFQQSHFQRRIVEGKLKTSPSRKWHEEMMQQHYTCNESTSQDDGLLRFASLVHGIASELASPSGLSKLPIVFQYDRARLQQLRTEVQNQVHLDLCGSVLKNFLGSNGLGQDQSKLTESLSQLFSRLFNLLGDDVRLSENVEEVWQNNVSIIALEIARAISIFQGGSINEVAHQQVDSIEQCLSKLFQGQFSLYQRTVDKIHEQIEKSTMIYAQKFQKLTPFAIAEEQRKWRIQKDRTQGVRLPDLEDNARKVAHIAVLNWAVFSSLVYNRQDDGLDSGDKTHNHSLSSRSVSTLVQSRRSSTVRLEDEDLSGSLSRTAAERNHIG